MKELCFYRILLEGDEVYSVTPETYELVPILEALQIDEKPIPYYGAMLFFQDIDRTRQLHKLKPQSMKATRDAIDQYWYRLNFGKFNTKPIFGRKSDCMDWCKYYEDICEYNPVWVNIDNAVR